MRNGVLANMVSASAIKKLANQKGSTVYLSFAYEKTEN